MSRSTARADLAKSASKSSKFVTPWKIFHYEFKTKVENFEFSELHQAILDASTAVKAQEAIEGMLSHALELGTVGQVVTFLVKTTDILDGVSTILRKFPASQVPFATLLNAFSFAKEQNVVTAFAKLMGLRKVLRVITNDLVWAGLASMLANRSVGEAFAASGHDAQLPESLFKITPDDMAFRTAVAASVLGALAPHPAKDPATRTRLYDTLLAMMSSVKIADLVAAAKTMNDAFTHITNILRICGREESDRVEAPACGAPAPQVVQVLFARFLSEILADRSMDPLSNAMLRILYGMKPHPAMILSADLNTMFSTLTASKLVEPSIRLLVLYVCAKLVQAEYFHPAIVTIALDSVSNIGSAPDERTVALQLILGLLQKPETHILIDTTLTAEKIKDCFTADLQSANANLRNRWVCFIHMYTHAIGLTFSSLFVPLNVHIANRVTTSNEFKAITKWEWSEAKDQELLARIQSVKEQQVAVTGEESSAREALVDEELETRRSLLERYAARLAQLFADPMYVKWRRLRDEAMEDHSKICDDRIVILEGLCRKLKQDGKQMDDTLKKSVDETVQSAIAAHEAELRGIVWDSEELAGKKAVLDARITRLRRNAEKQINDNKLLSTWRDELVGAMIGSMHNWNRSQLLRSSLLIVEKEEERIRGDGIVSSTKWYASNQNSIIAREAESRRRIFALMDNDEDGIEEVEEDDETVVESPVHNTSSNPPTMQRQASMKLNVIKLLSSSQRQISFVDRMKRVTQSRFARLKISSGDEPIHRLETVYTALRHAIELERNEHFAYLKMFQKRAAMFLIAVQVSRSQPNSTGQKNLMHSVASAVDLAIAKQNIVLDARDDHLVMSTSEAAYQRTTTASPRNSRAGGPVFHDHIADVDPLSTDDDSDSKNSADGWGPVNPKLVSELRQATPTQQPLVAFKPIISSPPLPTPAMVEMESAHDDSRRKLCESEWQWRVYHLQHFEHGFRRGVMQAEYQAVRQLTVAAMESKSRHAVAQSEREWFTYITKQFIAKQPQQLLAVTAPSNMLQLSVTSIGSTGFDNVAEPIFNAWKDRRARIVKHFADFMRNLFEMKDAVFGRFGGLVQIEQAEQAGRLRIQHAAGEFVEYSARALKEETKNVWPCLMLLEQERSWRGQVCLEEVIALSIILHDRPRGKRYRPVKEELVEEKPRVETSTSNRIKNWQKECIPSDIPERADSAAWWGVAKADADQDDEALFRNEANAADSTPEMDSSPGMLQPATSPAAETPPAEDLNQPLRTIHQVVSPEPSEVPQSPAADAPTATPFVCIIAPEDQGGNTVSRLRKRRGSGGPKFVGKSESESDDSAHGSVAVSNIGIAPSDQESAHDLSRPDSFVTAGVLRHDHIDPKLSEMSDALAAYHTSLQKLATTRAHRDRLRVDFEGYVSREILALAST